MTLSAVRLFLSAVLLVTLAPEDASCAALKPPPCAVVLCAPGTVCKEKQVQCFTTPCDPIASCEPIEATVRPLLTCATYDCAPGYYCIMEQVVCKKAPCPPRPRCVPVSTTKTT